MRRAESPMSEIRDNFAFNLDEPDRMVDAGDVSPMNLALSQQNVLLRQFESTVTDFQTLMMRSANDLAASTAARSVQSPASVESPAIAESGDTAFLSGFIDRELETFAEDTCARLSGLQEQSWYMGKDADLGSAQRDANQARTMVQQYGRDTADRRTMTTLDRYSGYASRVATDLYRGKDPAQTFGSIGNQVVTSAIDRQIRSWIDPQSEAVRAQTQALTANTAALNALSGSLLGHDPQASASRVDGHVEGVLRGADTLPNTTSADNDARNSKNDVVGGPIHDLGRSSGGESALRSSDQTDVIGNYLNAGLAAYGVFSQGENKGSNVGSVLGSALAGFSLGGPVGALVGGGLNLLGGLFHHSAPRNTQKETNPGLYNSPSDMDYNAYRYRVTGQLPTAAQGGMSLPPANNSPVINVSIDGAATAAKTVVSRSTSAGAASLTNTYVPLHTPV